MSSKTDKSLGKKLDNISRKMDMIIVIMLAQSGLNRKDIAEILGISEKTIERMLPFREIKKRA